MCENIILFAHIHRQTQVAVLQYYNSWVRVMFFKKLETKNDLKEVLVKPSPWQNLPQEQTTRTWSCFLSRPCNYAPFASWMPIRNFHTESENVKATLLGRDGDCSHETKRHLLLGRKVMTNLDSIFRSRD